MPLTDDTLLLTGDTLLTEDGPASEVDLGSIPSSEAFSPLVPGAGLRPRAGLVPDPSGALWADLVLPGSIASSEAWGSPPVLQGDFGGDLGSIPSGETWFSPPALPPHVGLYPHAGLHPERSGVSWVNISIPAQGIFSAEAWGNLLGVSVEAAKVVVYVAYSSALRMLVRVTS